MEEKKKKKKKKKKRRRSRRRKFAGKEVKEAVEGEEYVEGVGGRYVA